jgi:hypothetical protein
MRVDSLRVRKFSRFLLPHSNRLETAFEARLSEMEDA